jgi:hypothetical protein
MTIYKHMEAEWLDAFCSGSSVLIRPLSEYRKMEALDPDIGDRLEGRVERHGSKAFDRLERGSEDYTLLESAGMLLDGENVVLNNISMENSVPDLYIFCASVSPDARVSKKYNAVARIIDARAFGDALLDALRPHGVAGFMHRRIEYRDDIEGDLFIDRKPAPRPSPFYKRSKFSGDLEYSFAFPATRPLQPKIIIKPKFTPGLVEPVRK